MKTLQQLREKYWSNTTSLYPATTSPSNLEVRFDFSQFVIDKDELKMAQTCFYLAKSYNFLNDINVQLCNQGNYHLAGAYQIEGKNVEFWGQF